MNWKIKALMQSAVSLLPSEASMALYYGIQRTCGTLRSVDPLAGFADGLRLVAGVESAGGCVQDAAFLEVGTGRRINVPIALWLCGAGQTITIDRARLLKPSLVHEELAFVRANADAVQALFGARAESEVFQRRFAELRRDDLKLETLLRTARIRYVAPVEARALPFADRSVDYHVSNNVIEHVPPNELRDILLEGRRLIGDAGLLVHRVDFADHFCEIDGRITTVNFLQYSEDEWRRYGGNWYNYHNRLRIDELEEIIAEAGLVIAGEQAEIDWTAARAIESGFTLDARFAGKPTEVNATKSAVLIVVRAEQARDTRPYARAARATA